MDFEERTNLVESRTSAYCDLIKQYIQVFNSIISTNPVSAQQFQSDLQTRLEPYTPRSMTLIHNSAKTMQIGNNTISHHLQSHNFNLQTRDQQRTHHYTTENPGS